MPKIDPCPYSVTRSDFQSSPRSPGISPLLQSSTPLAGGLSPSKAFEGFQALSQRKNSLLVFLDLLNHFLDFLHIKLLLLRLNRLLLELC